MRRTIERKRGGEIYYRGNFQMWITPTTMSRFGIQRLGKYYVDISEGEDFKFEKNEDSYTIRKKGRYVISFCQGHFSRIFFRPDCRKRYNITVRKLK